MNKSLFIRLGLIGIIITAGLLFDCGAPSNPEVTNGTLHETAELDISGYSSVVVPETATVEKRKGAGHIEIQMEKEVDFHGHPPHPLRIEKARDYFGVASRKEGDALVLGTYGEWSSIEGGAYVRMLVVVPEEIVVLKRADLSGENSRAKPPDDNSGLAALIDSPEFRRCYWYTAISPAPGWTRVEGKSGSSSSHRPIQD